MRITNFVAVWGKYIEYENTTDVPIFPIFPSFHPAALR